MKLSLAVLAVLLIVSLCAYPIIYADLYAEHTTVELTENVLYGDVSEADGLYVTVHTHCDHRLFWDTTYTFGSKPVTETEFEFTSNRNYYRGENPDYGYDGVEMWINSNIGISSGGGTSNSMDSPVMG